MHDDKIEFLGSLDIFIVDDFEVSAQLVPPTVLLTTITAGIKIILLMNSLDMAHQEILRLEESMTAKTLVLRAIHHLY